MDSAASRDAARGFIRALYREDDHVAVLAVERGGERRVRQRIKPAGSAAGGRFQAWLRHLNARGYDIFIGMNPIRAGSDGREKADVAQVRRLQLDLDANGPDSLRRVLADAASGRLPPPAILVRSSRDHYQVLWHTAEGWAPESAEDTMARLAQQYGGDSVNDVSRCMRLPGFRNKKPGRDDAAVVWTEHGGAPVRPGQFAHLPPAATLDRDPGQRPRPRPASGSISQSERDWAMVRQALRDGRDPGELIAELASQRQDKDNPDYYARRTVTRAAESLGRRLHSVPDARNSPSLADGGARALPAQHRPGWKAPER